MSLTLLFIQNPSANLTVSASNVVTGQVKVSSFGNLAISGRNVVTGRVNLMALTDLSMSGFNGMRARVSVGTFTPIGQLAVTGLNVSFSGIIVETVSLPNPSRTIVVYP